MREEGRAGVGRGTEVGGWDAPHGLSSKNLRPLYESHQLLRLGIGEGGRGKKSGGVIKHKLAIYFYREGEDGERARVD